MATSLASLFSFRRQQGKDPPPSDSDAFKVNFGGDEGSTVPDNPHLQKMLQLFTSQWTSFVAKEKKVTKALEAKVERLTAEGKGYEVHAEGQIKALRNAVHKDMSNLTSMAQQQAARASDAEKRLVRSVSCGVQILQRKERQKLLQALFIAWRDAARAQRVLAANVVRQLIRTNGRYCRRALTAWSHAIQAQHAKRAMLHRAIQRMASAKLRAGFHAWVKLVQEQQARRQHHFAIVKKVQSGSRQRLLRVVISAWKDTAVVSQASLHLAQVAAASKARKLTAEGFACWHSVYELRGKQRAAVACFAQRSAARRCKAAVVEWKDQVQQAQLQQAQFEDFMQRRVTCLLQKALRAWCERMELLRASKERGAVRRHQVAHERSAVCFELWCQYAAQQRIAEHQAARLREAQQHRTMAAVLAAWHSEQQQKRTARRSAEALRRKAGTAHMFAAFAALREHATLSRAAEQAAAVFAAKRQARLRQAQCRQVWVGWTDAVEFGRRTQGLLHRFEARRKACVLRAAISAWQGAVQSRHAFIARFQDMLDRRGMQLMDGAFCGWRDAAAASRSQRESDQALVIQLYKSTMAAALSAWREHCDEISAQRQVEQQRLQAAVRRLSRAKQGAVLAAWQLHAKAKSTQRERCWRAIRRLAARRMRSVLHAWRDKAASMATLRCKAEQLRAAADAARLAQSWREWRCRVDDEKRSRELLRRGESQLACLRRAQILEAWAGIAQHFKLQRSAADELQKRNMHKTLRVCLGSWAAHAKDMQQLRQVASAHGDAVAKQLAHSQMHMSLTGWRGVMEERRVGRDRLQKVAARITLGNLGIAPTALCMPQTPAAGLTLGVLMKWRSHCQDQQRLRGIMYKVYAKRATALQNSAFAAWRSAAAFAHERRAALRALILCSRHRRLQSAIDKWRQVIGERELLRNTVRTCIMQKKVSFAFFKQWYWDCFDEDVQATLRQLYAATEASMGSPLPSPVPSHSSPHALGAAPGRFSTPSLDLPLFNLPTSSTQRSIERHRDEALEHLPGRAAAGQAGTIGQALVCILGAAASSSSSAESADTDAEQASGQASGLGLQPEAASSSTLQLSRQSGHETMAELAPCQPFNCFAHEHRAGQQGHAKTPRGFDAAGSSFAGQQQGNQASTQSAHGTTEQFEDAGVHSPVSLADGVACVHGEADADGAHLHATSMAPDEPDTCVLFRPAALHSKAHEDSWLPGKHALEVNVETSSEQQAAPASNELQIVARQELVEPDSTAGAGSKRDTSARQVGASGKALQLFSPVEAIRGFSRVNSEACGKPKEVAHPSSRAAQQATAPAQAGATQHAQRYSKVHAVTDQQRFQSQVSDIQVEHIKPADAGVHQASGDADSGHILRAFSVFLEASGAEQAQQPRQASVRVGKENDLPALPVAPVLSSAIKGIHDMGGHYVVQDNPLSALEPSPERNAAWSHDGRPASILSNEAFSSADSTIFQSMPLLEESLDQANPRRSLQTALSMAASKEPTPMHSPALSVASPQAGRRNQR